MVLALSPLRLGLGIGQPSIIAGSLAIMSLRMSLRQCTRLAGALLGIAMLLKPQLGLGMLIYFLMRRELAAIACALAIALLGNIFGAFWITLLHVNPLREFLRSVHEGYQIGGMDASSVAALRGQMVNIQSLVAAWTSMSVVAEILAWATSAALAALCWKGRNHSPLLTAATLCAISLLPIYHRDYDILLLLPALLWCISALSHRGSRTAGATLICMLIFCLPIEGIFQMFARVGWIPRAWQSHTWWQATIVASYAWTALAISVLLVMAMRFGSRGRSPDG
jgi:hypothetical protein